MAIRALFSSEDLERIQAATGKDYELVRGELFEVMPPNKLHGVIAVLIAFLIQSWNRTTNAGWVSVESGYTLERQPDTVRGPDVSFVTKGRLTSPQMRKGFPQLAPDLAVEIRSPNDSWQFLQQKAREYLMAGSRMVWLVEPEEFVEVLRPGRQAVRLGLDDELSGEDVLPGFACIVREFFPAE